MARGFGVAQSKKRGSRKSASQTVSEKQSATEKHETEIREEIQTFLDNDQKENPEHYSLAWQAGVYNPLDEVAQSNARPLEVAEEDWLFLAKEVGWLEVEDELDAIYFTAPPPNFDPNQADWYIRPDLTHWLEEPELLSEAVHNYPISAQLMLEAIARYTEPLGWCAEQIEAFIQKTTEHTSSEMTVADFVAVLLELQQR